MAQRRGEFSGARRRQKLVVDAGKSKTPKDEIGEVLYNRGVYNSMLIAEAIAEAQKDHRQEGGHGRGSCAAALENLDIDDARLKAIGLGGFVGPIQDELRGLHQQPFRDLRPAMGRREMGQGERRDRAGSAKVMPLLEDAAKAYAEKNAGWPARSEPCDNK